MPLFRRSSFRVAAVTFTCALLLAKPAAAETTETRLQALSQRFWQWRATEQPFTDDDIPRIERPAGFTAQWSAAQVVAYKQHIAAFEREWRALRVTDAAIPVEVDYRLLGSAIARVRWELEVFPVWRRDPSFYVDQGLGAVYTALLPPPPVSTARQADLLARLESVPRLLNEGRSNLTDMRQPYAAVTLESLAGIEDRLQLFREGVHAAQIVAPNQRQRFDAAEDAAVRALVAYREWLRPQLGHLRPDTAVGRDGYLYFLRNVALLAHTPEQILAVGRSEWQRAVASEELQQAADTGLPETPLYKSTADQIAEEERQEPLIRHYLVAHGLLSEPAGVQHYHYAALPPYLAALSFLGVTDDLTGPSRLEDEATSYKAPPREGMDFFSAITARDTRPLSIHEGVPGHFYQMAWSWHHPDEIRRHYYDSESNEGIGFYAEEMMMIAGLFDAQPKTREAIYSMMRLRALRVEVDVKLATGEFSLQQAAAYLERTVPMDRATALGEASAFASTPGQAITYQIGKADILHLMTDAREQQGKAFRLQTFQDFVWLNGNVPFSLQRWELLHDRSAVPPIPQSFAVSKP